MQQIQPEKPFLHCRKSSFVMMWDELLSGLAAMVEEHALLAAACVGAVLVWTWDTRRRQRSTELLLPLQVVQAVPAASPYHARAKYFQSGMVQDTRSVTASRCRHVSVARDPTRAVAASSYGIAGQPRGPAALSAGEGDDLPLAGQTIAVFGASGLTGAECVYQALRDGARVVGLTRNPDNMEKPKGSTGGGGPLVGDKLTMFAGSVTNPDDVEKVFNEGITGVVVALGGKTKDVGKTMLTDGTRNIIDAMKARGVKRIAVVTSIGAGDSKNQAPFFFKILMNTVMSDIFTDKNNQEALVASSGLEYCIVRPGGLTVDPPTGVINVIDGEAGSIPRADVASFCLGAVTKPDFEYLGAAPCISSTGGTSWVKDRSSKARTGE